MTRWPRPLVFTNGCFDLLHAGHVRYLMQASLFGAALMVAVNSDASVRALKGEGRPINTANDRMLLLSELRCVAHVLQFYELTPLKLLVEIRPDIYVKGGDYDVPNLPEAALVKSWGGRAVALPFHAGYSTTGIVERIRG